MPCLTIRLSPQPQSQTISDSRLWVLLLPTILHLHTPGSASTQKCQDLQPQSRASPQLQLRHLHATRRPLRNFAGRPVPASGRATRQKTRTRSWHVSRLPERCLETELDLCSRTATHSILYAKVQDLKSCMIRPLWSVHDLMLGCELLSPAQTLALRAARMYQPTVCVKANSSHASNTAKQLNAPRSSASLDLEIQAGPARGSTRIRLLSWQRLWTAVRHNPLSWTRRSPQTSPSRVVKHLEACRSHTGQRLPHRISRPVSHHLTVRHKIPALYR